jgi:UDP-glucose 4-epimerase
MTRFFPEETLETTGRRMKALVTGGAGFNVESVREVTIDGLAARVRALAGSASPIVHVPYEEAYQPGFEDLRRRVPDIRKAERVAGYRPAVPLDETLSRVIRFIRETGRQ